MWIFYVFVIVFNMLFGGYSGKMDIRNDGSMEEVCGGPGGVNTNNGGGAYDEPTIPPELP